ncbi:unnamed protein product [Macrosiphum euphorbiae]|uniref:CCHC-type domain-containing protein n=1 Tax=Macrosiphum euphorbiae TaxID=13131 RepID=A0AAV0VES0_9HEMI|nr:unnamed protein product [Macrosiphum euphorbiae]
MPTETDKNVTGGSAQAFDTNDLVRALLEQNRLREQQMDKIINKLMETKATERPTASMLPVIMQTVPVFNGETGDTDVAAEWLRALKTAALVNKWSDACTLETGRSHLAGAARNWYLCHMSDLESFQKFATLFEETFMGHESITETWKSMNERVQRRDETVFAYFHEKVRLCRRLGLTAIETKKMVCVGLHSRELSSALLSNGHTSETELVADIRTFNEVDRNRSERYRNTAPRTTPIKSKPKFTSEKEPTITKETKNVNNMRGTPSQTSPRCYNCQLSGHIARDCDQPRKPLKCNKCKREGHTAKYCQVNITDVNLISVQPKSSIIHYIKEVRINEHEDIIHGLVDTGSAVSIIKRSTAVRFGLEINSRKIDMWAYGTAQPVISLGEAEAVISIDEVQERVKLIVVNDNIQQHEIIIGRSFIELENVTFIKTKNQLVFGYDMKFPYQESDIPRDSSEKTCIDNNS